MTDQLQHSKFACDYHLTWQKALNMPPPALLPLLSLNPSLSTHGTCMGCFWHVENVVCKLFSVWYTAASVMQLCKHATEHEDQHITFSFSSSVALFAVMPSQKLCLICCMSFGGIIGSFSVLSLDLSASSISSLASGRNFPKKHRVPLTRFLSGSRGLCNMKPPRMQDGQQQQFATATATTAEQQCRSTTF